MSQANIREAHRCAVQLDSLGAEYSDREVMRRCLGKWRFGIKFCAINLVRHIEIAWIQMLSILRGHISSE